MAVSPFHRPNHAKMPVFLEPKSSASSAYYHPLSYARRNLDPRQKAALRTRGSVRRAAASSKSLYRSSYERGCQGKKLLPAPLRDAGVVTYIQPHLIPHLIVRGVIGLVALARRAFPRRCQPQLLVPTRRFHEVSGARRRSVPKLRKLSVGLSANHDPM